MLIFDSLPPKIGEVHFDAMTERAILKAHFMEPGVRGRVISNIGEQATATLLNLMADVETGTGEAGVVAHSLWEGHPVLSHQPDHGAFIAGVSDAQRKYNEIMDVSENVEYERLVRKEIPV